MKRDELVRSLSLNLPEDILKRKWAGDFEGAQAAISAQLAREDLPRMLRARFLCEQERLRRLPTQYPYDREKAIALLREKIPDLTEAEFDAWETAGLFDWIHVRGEKRYFVRNHRGLMTRDDVRLRAGDPMQPANPYLDRMIETIRTEGKLSRRITIDARLYMTESAFAPGSWRGWIPYPAKTAQQHDITLVKGSPVFIAPEDAPARTAYFEAEMTEKQDFTMTFAYTSTIRYADPLGAAAPAQPLYDCPAPTADDLAEELPWVRFTPYLRSLAAEIAGDEKDPVQLAWRCYRFVTEKVKYAFVRDYFQIDDIGEHCAINLKGDCGLQALLFIELCRILGIPARWQSGLSIDADGVGAHDWAQFYLPGWGWLFADPSYGGSAFRSKAYDRQRFYFGNIDPMRVAANSRFMGELQPQGDYLRTDPYDNQSGELERVGAAQALTMRDVDCDFTLVSAEDC